MTSLLETTSKWLDRLASWMVILFLSFMVIVTTTGVISRYGFNSALSWSEELGRYLLVWISFLGATLATYKESHIGISLVFDRFPIRGQFWVGVIVDIIIILFMGSILIGGIKTLPFIHVRISPTLTIPMSVPYLIMPFSAGVIIFHIQVRLVISFKKRID
ncbi:MAG: TRAP transporter small permease [Proteobacteria bacterium]|nr:TRAP transporter small permease [Pseudomonadota bacterium]